MPAPGNPEAEAEVDRTVSIIQILIRENVADDVAFLLHPHAKWHTDVGEPYTALPTKTQVGDEPMAFDHDHGTSFETFVDDVMQTKLGLKQEQYVLETELEPVVVVMPQSSTGVMSRYMVYPVEVWVSPAQRELLRERVNGAWLTPERIVDRDDVPPTVRAVFEMIPIREAHIIAELAKPEDRPPSEGGQEPHKIWPLLLDAVPDKPTMDGTACKWFAQHKQGVRVVTAQAIDHVLDVGDRAFNLRVADPYKRYQLQGLGFTWSFFTQKDGQDVHVHGSPVVEIYGIIEGEMEIWFKPYYDRGVSAWSHRVLKAGDWAEVESLQCHIVHWLTDGKAVVFKAGPGPLAEVGKLGVKGKTPCAGCPCAWPQEVRRLAMGD